DADQARIMGAFTTLDQLSATMRAEIPAKLAREFPSAATLQTISAYDGNVTATLHSEEPPSLYCYRNQATVTGCELSFIIAKKYTKRLEPSCLIADDIAPGFGNLLGWPDGDAVLVQPPAVRVEAVGHGIAAHMVIDYVAIDQVSREPFLQSWKFSLLFQGGYYVACVESQAGYKQTFAKYVDELFRNVVVTKPAAITQLGYAVAQDAQMIGLAVTRVMPAAEGKGIVEAETQLLVQARNGQLLITENATNSERGPGGELLKQVALQADNRGAQLVFAVKATGSEARFVTAISKDSEQESKVELTSPLRTLLDLRADFQRLLGDAAATTAFSRIAIDNGLAVPIPFVAARDGQGRIVASTKNRVEIFTVDKTGRLLQRQADKLTWQLLAE
nr:hypothetical protein [Kofleriaceae bacterium]